MKIKIKKTKRLASHLGLIVGALFIFVVPAHARTFDPNNIISDQELHDANSLTKTAIQVFLERQNSILATYTQVVDSVTKKASQIIWDVAQQNNVNPKFLLTTLEKEQGLISKSSATQKSLDWATGYGCPDGSRCNAKYQGFYNQVDSTAQTQTAYEQKAGQLSFQVGRTTITADNYPVTPVNQATANLYIYTPHVGNAPELGVNQPYGANKLFWRIWERYFTYQPFVDGQIITNGTDYWLISNNTKRKFTTADLYLQDHTRDEAIVVNAAMLGAYPDGVPVKFADNSVVRSSSSNQLYLLTDNQRRPLADSSALALLDGVRIATTESDVHTVDEADLAPYALGGTISASSVYPQGKLLKDETGAIWLLKDGLKSPVDPMVLQNRFGNQTPEATTSDALASYPVGNGILLKDGTFVTSGGQYYLISSGQRMRIDDLGVFARTFGPQKQSSALTVSAALLGLHPAGETISYIDDTVVDPVGSTDASIPVSVGTWSAIFNATQPDGVTIAGGESQQVTVLFKNNGTATWRQGDVYIQIVDNGKTTSSFNTDTKIFSTEPQVGPDGTASFAVTLTAPQANGLQHEQINLIRVSTGETLASVGKFINVKPNGNTAKLVSTTIPAKITQKKKGLVSVSVKIKNTSKEVSWTSRKTALEAYNTDGTSSAFYDSKDWVRKEVAGVPINKSTIKPGETAQFNFTLDARKLKKGTYTINFKLHLIDKDKQVLVDGKNQFTATVKVE